MKIRINTITLASGNLRRSLDFYKDVLGLTSKGQLFDFSDQLLFELKDGVMLALSLNPEMESCASPTSGGNKTVECIFTHTAESKSEVITLLQRAKAAGASVINEAQDEPWGYCCLFQDPDGHSWEIVCPVVALQNPSTYA